MEPSMNAKDSPRGSNEIHLPVVPLEEVNKSAVPTERRFFNFSRPREQHSPSKKLLDGFGEIKVKPEKSSLGILNDRETDEVPGRGDLCEANGFVSDFMEEADISPHQKIPARTSASSLPSLFPPGLRPAYSRQNSRRLIENRKRTPDGKIILEPQPDDSMNDPLNWPSWRRDIALLSLGFYCMLGGGMTPILAAGFNNIASTYHVSIPKVALTTGFYMMGLGLGSVVASPTAILYGKRPVYLVSIILYIISSIWCAVSPNYISLVIARIFMGFAVSPVECLPSATIAEIFFLHERAYRLGIYTLLLLSGKNLIPLVSAAIIQSLGWPWVFWIVAMIVGLCFFLMLLFVPETFWDRTLRPYSRSRLPSISGLLHHSLPGKDVATIVDEGTSCSRTPVIESTIAAEATSSTSTTEMADPKNCLDVECADYASRDYEQATKNLTRVDSQPQKTENTPAPSVLQVDAFGRAIPCHVPNQHQALTSKCELEGASYKPISSNPKSSGHLYLGTNSQENEPQSSFHRGTSRPTAVRSESAITGPVSLAEKSPLPGKSYTTYLTTRPPKSFKQTLKPWNGRLRHENWFLVALRPFVLFAYPGILWSTLVYSLSIGWLIVLSESVSSVYRNKESYNFSSLGTGLVYISPFIGGILGTAVAGKVSDIVVRYMSRRNEGIYEPEFRLIMAIPVALSTCIGLMGFGWSAAEKDKWIVPTVFFGVISFGCSLGSTTAITFAVDSYRQYAGEALVTLNLSKNIFHGLVFSLFFTRWLEADGSKNVFLAIGGIQLACLCTTVPMYIYGKRARMWTVRRNLMEKL